MCVQTIQALISHPVGRFPFLMPNVHPYKVSQNPFSTFEYSYKTFREEAR